jgi:group II intron reverse transcriptase/maturase
LHGTWEIQATPETKGNSGRSGKAVGRSPDMYVAGKSDDCVVPKKPANEAGETVEESVEGRRSTKGNVTPPAAPRTRSRASASNGLRGVRDAARRDRRTRFTALLHHVTVARLRSSFFALKRRAAPGVDGVTWREYREGLDERLADLHTRVHRGSYRAQPSRRTYIPKPDGRQRPLGIAALEDKLVQHAVGEVLSAIYEEDFVGFSYGFRPGRGQHDALDALWVGLMHRRVSWVLDADIRGFFDALDHGWLLRFLEPRIGDRRILRLVRKWLRSGTMEDGRRSRSERGTPQGAVISPLLANVYLHYVLDLWVKSWRESRARGEVIIVRYADDFVVGFQHHDDAMRFRHALVKRLDRFGLALHPDKTRLIRFGRFAAQNRAAAGQGKPETFDFLGFTHMCGTTKTRGRFMVWRKTMAKRFRATLKSIRERLRAIRHWTIPAQGAWLRRVIQGWMNYHSVPGNFERVEQFLKQIARHWLKSLRSRSQRDRLTWERFNRFAPRYLVRARVLHPWPDRRFYAKHPR